LTLPHSNWHTDHFRYTLAVGKAPFHAAKKEEIYVKLQKREYEWPDLSQHQNDISNDLRELVGRVLVDEDARPGLDTIVSHSFFKTAFIPDQIPSTGTSIRPSWSIKPPSAAVMRRGYSDCWWELCQSSGVGEYAPGQCFPVAGGGVSTSIYKECEREIKAGKQPEVPVREGTVYTPFVDTRRSKSQKNNLSKISEEKETSGSSTYLTELSSNSRNNQPPNVVSVKSHASLRLKENMVPAPLMPLRTAASTEPRRAKSTRGRVEGAKVGVSRETTIKIQRISSDPPKQSAEQATQQLPDPTTTQTGERLPRSTARGRLASKEAKSAPTTEDPPKTAGTLLQERPIRVRATRTASQTKEPVPIPAEIQTEVKTRRALPPSNIEPLPSSNLEFTDPVDVLARATQLRNNLISVLSTKAGRSFSGTVDTLRRSIPLPFVSKWVDYSKKHGIGYVLADGSIGCVLIGSAKKPVTHVVVRNGYTFLSKPFQDAVVSISKIPLKFYTQQDDGLIELKEMDGDKRKANGILWAKFGRYMCQTLSSGNAEKKEMDDGEQDEDRRRMLIVRFYQRVGTVGVWGFSDGCFQVSPFTKTT
jgi:myosin-1